MIRLNLGRPRFAAYVVCTVAKDHMETKTYVNKSWSYLDIIGVCIVTEVLKWRRDVGVSVLAHAWLVGFHDLAGWWCT
jgi:hypothetical protein